MSVTYAIQDQVATITFDDGKANVYTHDVLDELGKALDKAGSDARAVLLVGRPGRFSAGFDLATMTASPESCAGWSPRVPASWPDFCWSPSRWWPPAPGTPWPRAPWCCWRRTTASA